VYGLLTFVLIWHLCVYSPISHITWNHGGFLYTNTIEDFSGGLVVHMTAGITAVISHLFLDYWAQAPKAEPRRPHNSEGTLFAAVAVWFLWFGINAGKAHAANFVAANSVLNTIAGVSVSLLTNYALDVLEGFKFSNTSITNSILIGLIATTPCSGYVTVGGSMVVTIITMLTVRVLGKYLFKETLEDTPYSIGVLHGIGGSTAFLFTAMMSYEMTNSQGHNGLTWGRDTLIRHHTAAVLAMWVCGSLSILVVLFVSNLFVPLSKARQSPLSPKGEYAPAPFGPFVGKDESFYKNDKDSNFNIGKVSFFLMSTLLFQFL
jgi:Amt family ammonium transporter